MWPNPQETAYLVTFTGEILNGKLRFLYSESNDFWYVKVCIFWKCIQYTIHWDKSQMLKKISCDKMNDTKNALFFLSQAPTHHSFTFNLRILYELKHAVRLSKTACGISHFQFRFVFIKFIFLFNKMHGIFDFKTS